MLLLLIPNREAPMGSIQSPLLSIERVHFRPIASVDGVKDIKRLTQMGHHGHSICILTNSGTVFTTGRMGRPMHLSGSTVEEVRPLVGLGLVTKQEFALHRRYVEAVKAFEVVWDQIKHFNHLCEKLNIKRTAAVLRKLDKKSDDAYKTVGDISEAAKKINEARKAKEVIEAARAAAMMF